MADTSLDLHELRPKGMRGTAQVQVHDQHRLQLGPQTVLVLGQGALFRHVNPDDFMWTGEGERHLNVFVPFTKALRRVPVAQVNLAGVDASHAQNLRLKLRVSETYADGFIVSAHTWQDTKLASVDVSWMAIDHGDARPPAWVAASRNHHGPS